MAQRGSEKVSDSLFHRSSRWKSSLAEPHGKNTTTAEKKKSARQFTEIFILFNKTFDQKLRLFQFLVSMGFKEIEVGHPSANQGEFDFIRHLVDTPGLIPKDVLIQVIAPCREEAVKRAVQSVQGAAQAIIFTYLPSSDNYRTTVLGISEEEWVDCAARVAKFAREITTATSTSTSRRRKSGGDDEGSDRSSSSTTKWTWNFGFEDFANARLEAVVRCAEAVKASWGPSVDARMIFSLASSVESSMPNVFADQVERFCQSVSDRSCWLVSVHTHNDRGGAISTAELASLAGADRVEGCLFGNGERAGNMDLITYALNRVSEGIDWAGFEQTPRCSSDISRHCGNSHSSEDALFGSILPESIQWWTSGRHLQGSRASRFGGS